MAPAGRLSDEAVRPALLRAKVSVLITSGRSGRDQTAGRAAQGAGDRGARAGERAAYRSLAGAVPQIVWTTDAAGRRSATGGGTSTPAEARPERATRRRSQSEDVPEMLEVGAVATDRRPVRGRVPMFVVRTVSTAGISAARFCLRDDCGRDHRLGRPGDRHPRSPARGERQRFLAEAGWVLGQLAELRADARGRRPARRPARRGLVHGRHLRRRQARAAGARARRPAQVALHAS